MEGIDFVSEFLSDETYITVSTSGSTGIPKTIQLSKSIMRDSAERTNRFFNINRNSHLHSAISDQFIGGKMMIVRSIIAQCNLTCEPPSMKPLKNLQDRTPIDLLAVVPAQMWGILSDEYQLPVIRNIIIGGAPVPENLKTIIYSRNFKAWETYGMTETASHIALKEITPGSDTFTALPGISITLDNRNCLVISTPLQYVTTNDVAELLSDTEFRILGRYDNMINTGGKKVNPIEIERELEKYTDVEFYVTSKKDDIWGEKIVVAINMSSQGAEIFLQNWTDIRKHLCDYLPNWKIPKEIIALSSFTRTANGKLIRKKF